MYLGEVSVAQDELNSFLNVAEELRVKGLTQTNNELSAPKLRQNTETHLKKISTLNQSETTQYQKNTAIINTVKLPSQVLRDRKKEVSVIKSEPSELLPQRPPARPHQARYDQQAEQEHKLVPEQLYDEDNGQGVEYGTVAIDDSYEEDNVYDYQYDDPSYEATGENIARDGQENPAGINS